MAERAEWPLNQGRFGTCVAHSFAHALATGLHEKYEVPCDPKLIVEKVKALCPCYDGHNTAMLPGEWNEIHANPGAAIEDIDSGKRYAVTVNCQRLDNFEEEFVAMERADERKMMMPCSIDLGRTTSVDGHGWHSVALCRCVPAAGRTNKNGRTEQLGSNRYVHTGDDGELQVRNDIRPGDCCHARGGGEPAGAA